MITRKLFTLLGQVGLVSFLALWVLLAYGTGGTLAKTFMFLAISGLSTYVWYQCRLRATKQAYPQGRDLLLACLLPLAALVGTVLVAMSYMNVLLGS